MLKKLAVKALKTKEECGILCVFQMAKGGASGVEACGVWLHPQIHRKKEDERDVAG